MLKHSQEFLGRLPPQSFLHEFTWEFTRGVGGSNACWTGRRVVNSWRDEVVNHPTISCVLNHSAWLIRVCVLSDTMAGVRRNIEIEQEPEPLQASRLGRLRMADFGSSSSNYADQLFLWFIALGGKYLFNTI